MFMCFDPGILFWAIKFRNNVGKDVYCKYFIALFITVKN